MESRQSPSKKLLDEQYEEDLAAIEDQKNEIKEELTRFTQETDKIVEKVLYLTRNDDWDKREFYQKMTDRNDVVRSAARRSLNGLEDERDEITRQYRKRLLDLETEEAENARKQDKRNLW